MIILKEVQDSFDKYGHFYWCLQGSDSKLIDDYSNWNHNEETPDGFLAIYNDLINSGNEDAELLAYDMWDVLNKNLY